MLITLGGELLREVSFGLPHRKSFLQDGGAKGLTNHVFPRPPIFLMKARIFFGQPAVAPLLAGLLLGTVSCRKEQAPTESVKSVPIVFASELNTNAVGSLPGGVYRSQASSPIHWQPWTKETMARAKDANRLVFAVIAMPQQPGFQSVLAELAKDPTLVSAINDTYVPVLIDGDASREIGLLTADLSTEIKRPLQLPLLLWLSPDGNPVAWIPVSGSSTENIVDVFNQSHSMVTQMWGEDVTYVLENSGRDNANRKARFAERKNAKVMSPQPAEDAMRSLRQLTSFYDTFSRSFDESGGLFPAGSIDLLASAAVHPGVPSDVRTKCRDTVRELMKDLVPSPMFDPLEGGVFTSRKGNSWAFPSFTKDCGAQARSAVSLFRAHRAIGDPRILEKAVGVLAFAEKEFITPEGLYSVGLANESNPVDWLWRVEDVEKELPAEDAAWWIKATGMKGLGNLPSEVDPRREFFRSNSMGLSKSMPEIAAELSLTPEEFAPRFEMTRKKLLGVRNARLGQVIRDTSSHAGATFRMISAYTAAFSETGDEKYRKAAVELLVKARTAFADGPKLRLFTKPAPASIGEARAFIYGLALQASLDVADITSDEKWVTWAEDLATTAAELFTGEDFLKECPDDAKIIDLPVTDLLMLFDDSTAGLVSSADSRLAERSRPVVESFSKLATPLPTYTVERPILHTDLLQAIIARHFRVSVLMGDNISPALKLSVERLPIRMVQRRAAKSKDEVPAGSVKVVFQNGDPVIVSTPEALQEVVLPSLKNS